jgi:hypothetical protein
VILPGSSLRIHPAANSDVGRKFDRDLRDGSACSADFDELARATTIGRGRSRSGGTSVEPERRHAAGHGDAAEFRKDFG